MKTITFLLGLLLISNQISAQEPQEPKYDLADITATNDETLKSVSYIQYYQLKINTGGNSIIFASLDNGEELTLLGTKKEISNNYPTPMALLNFVCANYGLKIVSFQGYRVTDVNMEYDYLLEKK